MDDKAYAERRKQMSERRKRRDEGPLFQPLRLGNRWYIVRWPDGKILTSTKTEEEARGLSRTYAAANLAA